MSPLSDPLFNESAADQEVIKNLLKEVNKLQGELHMTRIIKSADGKYYTGSFTEVSPEEVTKILAHAQQQLQELEAIAPANNANEVQTDAPQANPEAPVNAPVPAAPVTDPNAPAPAPAAPVEQPAVPPAPVAPPADGTLPAPAPQPQVNLQ